MTRRAASLAREPTSRAADSAEQIYERIKTLAMTFAIRPGERVNEVEVARSLNVSRTPLREALNRLLVEGFLTRAPNRGFIGRPLDAKQVFDLYELRRVLEASIVAIACERSTDEELGELERFVKASTDRPEDANASSLLALDEQFHERVARLTRNEEMLRAVRSINARIHYFRWIDMQNGRRRQTQQEHLRIVKALMARDAPAAARLIEGHIARRLDRIVDVIRMGFAEIYMREKVPAPERVR
ncbi:MAG: GntR family transcriptional regulator [Burkholderiales bacterium]|nr:GntR family transcriptional regulator [Burkholderiales bacterium]